MREIYECAVVVVVVLGGVNVYKLCFFKNYNIPQCCITIHCNKAVDGNYGARVLIGSSNVHSNALTLPRGVVAD